MAKAHHYDDRRSLVIVTVVLASLALVSFWTPTAQIVAKEQSCNDSPNKVCDYGYLNRCEAGCSDCNPCLQSCTHVCAEQNKFVDYCSGDVCACTEKSPCVK